MPDYFNGTGLYTIVQHLKRAQELCTENIIQAVHPEFSDADVPTAQEFVKLRDEIANALNFVDNSEHWRQTDAQD